MKTTFTSLFLFCMLYSSAQSFSSPESVEYDANHQRYIVANTNSNNLQKVIPGSAPTLFVSNVPSPYGIAIVGDTVYVCCNSTHLRGYNLTTGALAFDVNLGGTFLNGICTDFAGNIFVTDFSAKKVVRYNIASQQFNYFVGTAMAKTPNGIVFDPFHNRLVIATWGTNAPILGLNLTDSTISTLKSTTLSNIDGITIDEDGNFYAADWGSDGIYFFDSGFVNTPIKVVSGLSNPADVSYNVLSDTIAVPNTGNNTVTYYGFPRPKPVSDFDTVTVSYSKTICVLQNDLINGNVPLVLQSFSSPQFGSATVSGNCIFYTASNTGNDTINYVVCSVDTPSFCKTGTLVVTNISGGGNQAPIAQDDTASITQPNSITINVAVNDVDAIGDTLCVTSITGSSFFSLDISNCANIIFTPDSAFVGSDTCVYVICDNGSPVLCDTASLVINVTACTMPDPQIAFLCYDNTPATQFGCPLCAKFIVEGVQFDSIVWTFTYLLDGTFYDTVIVNDDTLVARFQPVSCNDADIVIPFGFDWVVCATTSSLCGSKTVCDTVTISWEGINEVALSNIHIFPNPASNVLTINMQNNSDEITRNYSAIEIVNAIGEKQKSFSKKGTQKIASLDVSDLPNGIYLATIVSDKHERRMLGRFTISR